MKNISRQYLQTSILAWTVVSAIGGLASFLLDDAIRFFTIGLSAISLLAILALWKNSTGVQSQSIQSAMMMLVILSIKMFASGAVFIYYFYFNQNKIFIPLISGFILVTGYSAIETYLVIKLSKVSKEKDRSPV
ncbi:MAG: hypothetical protein LC105_09930 [Chitinophagales bacterium]|nr:hypothetical protein [Chitinophagales bacterium]MCZ2394165.1 hypothetical protein [Chitinophagales bacterium]